MAAPLVFRRDLLSFARILGGISQLGPRGLNSCSRHRKCGQTRPPSQLLYASLSRFQLLQSSSTFFHTATHLSSTPFTITATDEPDTLFQKVVVLVKGHDRAVLDSYEFFATMAAKELGITMAKVFEPPKDIERLTLLKSVHIYKKHRVQYEMRTHYRCIELHHITGCTAQVYLEYIQRNLPEGVAMEVTKTAMEKIPDHILEPMWKDHPIDDKPSK
ncbi:PREDICTED: 28S ribosomal protein S10, mitochondrial isoform X1 [Cyprinodon variegatus]|uniref:28S ribosomal protein S10, mitochondrial isoform X1 n=1 Tax=Cyprinodon variegatus TaxID=28743 RepID=UPI0007426091|nr:PREDICTED: 28S ribosomal protein S10, mitochondrial isoform X1 [Cyprinodon variegatus]